ncbi:cupin domain-containing protein [Vibrio astriarenae]|uniref:Cupin domain-containing protein n=1 Tax=Vibrio astriarenae TaxID=1481923 RepID=A0A7Z2T310_9VIBR|nr:pirin family protein [Vibrio astriarenae]QIA63459.1 cupin domain-containing protein [Vibrio astriarenae]
MITISKSEQRGQANFSWLDSKHSFSFGSYYDPNNMGFSCLRVINDDVVAPNGGFETHGHRNMEIISFVLDGVIAHKDSEGNVETISTGEYQLMSAGSGIYHSEFNASSEEPLRFLQIWIEPNETHTPPSYQQQNFGKEAGLTPIATPSGENGTFRIKQNASLYQLVLKPNQELNFELLKGRNLYVHHVEGALSIDNNQVRGGDGVKIQQSNNVQLKNEGSENTLTLLFELP